MEVIQKTVVTVFLKQECIEQAIRKLELIFILVNTEEKLVQGVCPKQSVNQTTSYIWHLF